MRAIVISDAHGQPSYIQNALDHSKYNPQSDRLIFAGDVLDIGPSPQECLDILESAGAEMLWGNHEQAVLYGERIHPQDLHSFDFVDLLKSKVRGPDKWKVATSHDDVLISHAGVAQTYARMLDGYKEMGAPYIATVLNRRFECIDQEVIADEFWAQDSPLWFRPGLLCPLQGIVQVVGHTPPHALLPEFRDSGMYLSVDPYARNSKDHKRYRYAVIGDDYEVKVFDSNT